MLDGERVEGHGEQRVHRRSRYAAPRTLIGLRDLPGIGRAIDAHKSALPRRHPLVTARRHAVRTVALLTVRRASRT